MTIIAVLVMGFNSPEEAEASATRYRYCPKVHFWGNNGSEAYIILKIPDDNKYWSDYIAEHPETSFGGVTAEITYLDSVTTPENIKISNEKIDGDTTPCGSKCRICPSRGRCTGCPALNLDTR